MAGRYCTGLKIPWRHPNRHERECGPPLPSPLSYFQDCSPGGESFRTLERACSRTRRHSTTLLHNACCFYISNFVFFLGFPLPLLFLWNLNWRMVGRRLGIWLYRVGWGKEFLSGRVLLTPTKGKVSFYERFRVF